MNQQRLTPLEYLTRRHWSYYGSGRPRRRKRHRCRVIQALKTHLVNVYPATPVRRTKESQKQRYRYLSTLK